MKKIISIAMLAALLFTLPAMAQKNEPCNEKCGNKCKIECKAGECGAFAGLSLTDKQKEQLRDMRKSEDSVRREQHRAYQAQLRKCRQQQDSIKRVAQENRLKKIKEILTPEQYVTFLENSVLGKQLRPKPMPRLERKRPGHVREHLMHKHPGKDNKKSKN